MTTWGDKAVWSKDGWKEKWWEQMVEDIKSRNYGGDKELKSNFEWMEAEAKEQGLNIYEFVWNVVWHHDKELIKEKSEIRAKQWLEKRNREKDNDV